MSFATKPARPLTTWPVRPSPPPSTRTNQFRFLVCCIALFLMPGVAHAYIDPGTGSMLFQSALAILFGVGAALGRVRRLAARVWAVLFRKSPPEGDEN